MSEYLSLRSERVRAAGYKLTHARLTVLRALEESGGHVTSTEVIERVNTLDSSVGRASVFRALDLFTRLAIVRPTYIDTSTTPSYVLLPEGHHHHIICMNCGDVIEFEDCHLNKLGAELEARLNVRLRGHLLEFYGVCEGCDNG